jgi:segregation and condensation protein B
MEQNEKQVEAVLFTVGKEISVERIASLCSLSEKKVASLLTNLQEKYQQRDHALQLVHREDGNWKLTIRDEFVPLVSSIVKSTELDQPMMQTLAVIAWKYPILQSEVVKLRNASAYEHMRQLQEQGFIEKIKHGRTYKVKLTNKFFEYFDLPSEEAKQAFLQQVPSEVLTDAEEVSQEADEVERLIELDEQQEESRDEIKEAMATLQKD